MKKITVALVFVALTLAGLAGSMTPASASMNVYLAAPDGFGGIDSSMAFVPTPDPDLITQLENQQGSDADSTTYSQAFQIPADGTVDTVTWWGTGLGQTGFMVALHDGVWPTAPYSNLPNGPAVYGTLASLNVVPIASVAETPDASGLTRYQLPIPPTAMYAGRPYRLSITAVGGGFAWARSAVGGCCTGPSAINWIRGRLQSYLATSNVAFSLDSSTGTSVAPVVSVGANRNLSQMIGNQFEGSVAIDPSNAMRMFVLGRDEAGNLLAARSSDGGATWVHARIGASIANGGLPPGWGNTSVAFDEFGNLFVTYLGTGTTLSVNFALSTDGGATFTHQLSLDNLSDQPVVAVGAGSVWVTYNRGGLNTARGAAVTGLGAVGAFQPAQAIPVTAGHGFGDLTVGPAGEVMFAAGPTGPPGTVVVSVDPDGLGPAGFGAETIATNTNVGGFTYLPATPNWGVDSEAHLAWDQSPGPHRGRVYLGYLDSSLADPSNTDVHVAWSDDGGATWSTPVRVNDDAGSASQFMPGFAVDQTTGALGATWYDTRNDSTRASAQYFGSVSADGGATWVPNIRISTGASDQSGATPPSPIRDTDFGDYTGLAFQTGTMLPVWADNSNSTLDNPAGASSSFDLYTAVVAVTVPPVAVAPVVTGQPVAQSVTTGSSFSFTAAASGSPAPTVQWQASTDGGVTFADVVGATATTYTGTARLADNGARYRAVFTNSAGSATSVAATLTVTGTEVALSASTVTPVAGQTVKLTATVTDSVKPASVIAGSVKFYDGATLLGSKSFTSGGTATLSTAKLGVGAHSVTAAYRVTLKSAPVTSAPLMVTTSRAATTVALGSTPAKGTTTTLFTFTATVKVVAPGRAKAFPGTVVFSDGGNVIGAVDLTSTATAKLILMLPAGAHSVTASYLGNANLLPSPPSNPRTPTVI